MRFWKILLVAAALLAVTGMASADWKTFTGLGDIDAGDADTSGVMNISSYGGGVDLGIIYEGDSAKVQLQGTVGSSVWYDMVSATQALGTVGSNILVYSLNRVSVAGSAGTTEFPFAATNIRLRPCWISSRSSRRRVWRTLL